MTPWVNYPEVWKTQASFMAWLRGGIRRALWNRSPIKISFINKHRKRIQGRGKGGIVWGATCAICGNDFPIAKVDVDHKVGNHSLKEISDLQGFVEAIVLTTEDDLQFCCKECHKIKTYSEKEGVSMEEARAEKEAIQIIKQKKDKAWLLERKIPPGKNQKTRRGQIVEQLLKEINKT